MTRANAIQIGVVAVAALAVDQASKSLVLAYFAASPQPVAVTSFFNLRLGFNTGVSFGLFRDAFGNSQHLIALMNLAIALGFAAWAWRMNNAAERVSVSMIVGGALGNIADRFRQGAVTDFLDFHWSGWHWPTFNGADVFITAGAANLMLSMLWPDGGSRPKKRRSE